MQRREAKNRPERPQGSPETERAERYPRKSPQKRPVLSRPGNLQFEGTGWWRSSGPNWLLPTQSSNRSPKLESGTEFFAARRSPPAEHAAVAPSPCAAEYVRQDVRVRSNRDSRYQQMLSAFPPTAPASVKTLRAVRELLSILDRSGFEFSRSRFLADPLTRHPPKPVCLDFDVRLHQSVGMSGVGMSRARA